MLRWHRGQTLPPPMAVVIVYRRASAKTAVLAPKEIAALAGDPEVCGVDLCRPAQLHSASSMALAGAGMLVGGPWQGQGECIAVCDTGLTHGSLDDMHTAVRGRVRGMELLAENSDGKDRWHHGTSVAALAAGAAVQTAMGPACGMAPLAEVWFQVASTPDRRTGALPPGDLRPLLCSALANGANVFCAAWGRDDDAGSYDLWAWSVDDFVHANPTLLPCCSAGNVTDGAPSTVTPPGTARNAISVGTSTSPALQWPKQTPWQVPIGFAETPAADSARGPVARTERIKPDLVAPATAVIRAVGGPHQATANDYAGGHGTSFAVPIVAGAAAVIRSWLRLSRGCANPSAALVRALLVAGAVPLGSDPDGLPDFRSGFGRIDVGRSMGIGSGSATVDFVDGGSALECGEVFERIVTDVPHGSQLTTVLCWTDPPGRALQHELHLSVGHAGRRRLGNRKRGATQPDRANNVQRVIWPDLDGGRLTLQVHCRRAWLHAQEFALVWRVGCQPTSGT